MKSSSSSSTSDNSFTQADSCNKAVSIGNLTIPEFSSGVRAALIQGESTDVWGKIVDELIAFYSLKYPSRMRCSEDYQIVGKMLIKAYPCLE